MNYPFFDDFYGVKDDRIVCTKMIKCKLAFLAYLIYVLIHLSHQTHPTKISSLMEVCCRDCASCMEVPIQSKHMISKHLIRQLFQLELVHKLVVLLLVDPTGSLMVGVDRTPVLVSCCRKM